MKTMTGTVTKQDGHYFVVVCPEAPPHLRLLYLAPHQMREAKVGDYVRLAYVETRSSGLWNVAEVLCPECGSRRDGEYGQCVTHGCNDGNHETPEGATKESA